MNKCLVILVVASVAMGCAVGQPTSTKHGRKCVLKLEPPQPKAQVENFMTGDNSSIANFDGYLIYHPMEMETRERYMAVNLESINLSYNIAGWHYLDFYFDCMWFRMMVRRPVVPGKLWVEGISGYPYLVNNDAGAWSIFDEDAKDFGVDQNGHYKCDKQKSYVSPRPMNPRGPAYTVVINKFEFEIDGDTDKIGQGQFSLPAIPCK